MLIPLSWLKEHVEINVPFKKLAERMTEVGLAIESWNEIDGDIIFDPEITPNRPDLMSIAGIAREIHAATGAKLIQGKNFTPLKPKIKLGLDYSDDPKLCPRTSRVLIKGVKVKPSPDWLQKRIKQIGLRPINNLVDITNYVLWMYGNPLHVFDYDKIRGHKMECVLSKGGEEFRSLDGINYKLPKDAIIIKDVGRVIDLLPLKGGENTAVSNGTTNILLHSIVCDPVLTRRTSQALGLRSDSSAVSERGVDPNGTTNACLKALELILELAGGEVASELIESPKIPVPTWKVAVSHQKIEDVLGIKVSQKQVKDIWESLGLEVKGNYEVTIPTFRHDLQIEEDLVEEVGRIIGYNSFPKTLPASPVPTIPVAYLHDYDFDLKIRNILKGAGYSETYTYSLVSKKQLELLSYKPDKVLKIINPISSDYEYLRPTLMGNLLEALKMNLPNFSDIKIYEFGKQYLGETGDKATEEYWTYAILSGEKFYEAKGMVELLLNQLGIEYSFVPLTKEELHPWSHPARVVKILHKEKILGYVSEVNPGVLSKFGIKGKATRWSVNRDELCKITQNQKIYHPVPKYPAVVEDISLIIPENVLYQDVVDTIYSSSKLVSNVELIDVHEDSKLLRLTFLDRNSNLTDEIVAKAKITILRKLKDDLKVTLKD